MIKYGEMINAGKPIKPYRTPLAVITEDHEPSGRKVPADRETIKTSYVNRYGDPLGLKSSTYVSLLSTIEELPNFDLVPNAVVTHITSNNGKVNEVHFSDPAGNVRIVTAKGGCGCLFSN